MMGRSLGQANPLNWCNCNQMREEATNTLTHFFGASISFLIFFIVFYKHISISMGINHIEKGWAATQNTHVHKHKHTHTQPLLKMHLDK